MIITFILLLIFAYLLGSIPSGYLISKAKGVDIRKVGSGNIGGANVSRAFGWRWGLVVSICDILKGVIPTFLAVKFLDSQWQVAAVAIFAVLGHLFPVWLSFKGGKGVATTFGILIVLFGWKVFLVWIFIWILLLLIFKITSVTNLLMIAFIPLIFITIFDSLPYFVLGLVLVGLIWWAHRQNLKRIIDGKELKMNFQY
jgi:glycerol-3-phosphate acyltransferase PlsY